MDVDIDTDIGYGSVQLYNPQPGLSRQKSPKNHLRHTCRQIAFSDWFMNVIMLFIVSNATWWTWKL